MAIRANRAEKVAIEERDRANNKTKEVEEVLNRLRAEIVESGFIAAASGDLEALDLATKRAVLARVPADQIPICSFLAGENELVIGAKSNGDRMWGNYVRASKALAEGDRKKAKSVFEKVIDGYEPGYNVYEWSRAHLARMASVQWGPSGDENHE